MTMLITKQLTTNGYNTIATGDADTETTATVPRVPDCRSTWTTTMRSGSGVLAMVAGMLLLLAGGGTVGRMLPEGGSAYHRSAGSFPTEEVPGRWGGPRHDDLAGSLGLVVAAPIEEQCFEAPSTAKFRGVSVDPPGPGGLYWISRFETCWKRLDLPVYCWSRAQCNDNYCFGCMPMGGSKAAPWQFIKTKDVVNGCGKPCQEPFLLNP